jgi:formylglycine-generating enzyme required for sulfatase activity
MALMTAEGSAGATYRIDHEDGHHYRLDGKPVPSVTTIIGKGLPKPQLPGWAAREAATFAADNLRLLASMRREEAIALCKRAPQRDRDRAANRGTEVHRLAEQIATAEAVVVPRELVGHIEAYLAFREAWRPREEIVERPVFSRRHGYAGTFDLLARLPELGRTLLDIKTNRSGPFGEVALQLVAYARAHFMLGPDHEEPLPPIDSYAVLWLRTDGYDLSRYEVTQREWEAFLHIREVGAWLEERSGRVKGSPERPTAIPDAGPGGAQA